MYYIKYPETVGYVSRQSASEPLSRQPKIDRNRLERVCIGLVSHPNKCQIDSLTILAVMGNLGAISPAMRTVCHMLWERGCVLGPRAVDSWKWSVSISFGTGSIRVKLWNPISSGSGDMGMSTIFVTTEYPRIVDKMCQDENGWELAFILDFKLQMWFDWLC